MEKISRYLETLLNIFMAVALGLMVILVFGNVVLRYLFNSGITWSEEMSRYLFIWLTFLGAIGAFKAKEHLGVDMLVRRLPVKAKKVVLVFSDLLMLFVLFLVLEGSWKMTVINMDSKAPATGLPLSFVYGTGIVVSLAMGLILINNVYKILFNKVRDEDLIVISESEELVDFKEISVGKEEKQA
ncbi:MULTISPECIES: TRAP transporter small permease [Fictibacillus]|uniref:C4-dicarboxylate ABC transporter permease n=1 Tax=Fictibacillus enclensis TaxID=1017270 RepID=A0A0V8J083_9BACL|nr:MULTISPECIES: TRAP transporter small permease [Fictibacillus]KSU80264.1 C4-dicarboxylate ABC transporter permease [Fictibacillus enclensis]RXZ01739.1 TRAP transporter small permease [Fictibacillus sp. S7]SCC37319.1 TRAP-type C4-dicarboxylate transport system, small permease component [Fictibacillus enclensis]